MSTALAPLTFDYAGISAKEAKALEKHADAIVEMQDYARKTNAQAVIEVGAEFAAAQALLSNHNGGTFGKWCTERCGVSRMTAQRLISAHAVFSGDGCNKLLQHCDASTLYLLSKDSVPEEATARAIELAEQGERITHKRAKEIVAEFLPHDDNTPPVEPSETNGFALAESIERLSTLLEREEKKWPRDLLGTFAGILRNVADQIEVMEDSEDD